MKYRKIGLSILNLATIAVLPLPVLAVLAYKRREVILEGLKGDGIILKRLSKGTK